MTFVKRFLVALVMTFSMAAMTTYSSSAAAKGVEESGSSVASAIIEILGVAKKNAATATSAQLKKYLTDARQKSKLLSVGALASQVQFAWDGLRVAKKHYSYATKAAAGTGSYKGATEAEHRVLGEAQVIKSIADFEAIEKAIL
ncbi:MAG: hypothetical protein P8L84_06865 [Methylococcaceae bacterium]|jgi:hypothetical protein|nr:hypothetical protein [Methylococcaceae bacterium]